MSQPKVLGPMAAAGATTAASLPVTGSPVTTIVIAGVALLVGGLLVLRASRFRRDEV